MTTIIMALGLVVAQPEMTEQEARQYFESKGGSGRSRFSVCLRSERASNDIRLENLKCREKVLRILVMLPTGGPENADRAQLSWLPRGEVLYARRVGR